MENNANNKEEKSTNEVGKYIGMGFQMLVIIGLFTFAGSKLDAYLDSKQHLYTAGLSLLGVLVALFQMIRLAKKK